MESLNDLGKPLTVAEVAIIIGKSPQYVRKNYSRLGGCYINGSYFFWSSELRRALNAYKAQGSRKPLDGQGQAAGKGHYQQDVRQGSNGVAKSSSVGGNYKGSTTCRAKLRDKALALGLGSELSQPPEEQG